MKNSILKIFGSMDVKITPDFGFKVFCFLKMCLVFDDSVDNFGERNEKIR
jgi:hypothetical protein